MIDTKKLFDAIRDIKGSGLTQAEVDRINSIITPVEPITTDIHLPENPRIGMDLILGAREAERTYGVPASVSLAQWALESGWGKSMPVGSNNPFGMKARKNETGPTVMSRTREVDKNGKEYFIDAPFRKFKDMAEAFEEHAKLVGTAPVYALARTKLPDVNAFVDALGPIYATDPHYAALIKSIMKTNNLYIYNVGQT